MQVVMHPAFVMTLHACDSSGEAVPACVLWHGQQQQLGIAALAGQWTAQPQLMSSPFHMHPPTCCSWTNAASMLFIDSPAFTGFSKSGDNVTDRFWGALARAARYLKCRLLDCVLHGMPVPAVSCPACSHPRHDACR